MKITPKQYAAVLFQSIENKGKNEVKQILKNFCDFLVMKNDLGKAEKIIAEFSRIWNKEKGIVEVDVISARELESDSTKRLSEFVAQLTRANRVEVKERIDTSLLGGAVLRFGDTVWDGSLKNQLAGLKEAMER